MNQSADLRSRGCQLEVKIRLAKHFVGSAAVRRLSGFQVCP